jgi:cytochrome c oxidase cbb3-type subunit 1
VAFLKEPYIVRALGGGFFVSGMILMAYNVFMTIRQGRNEQAEVEAKLAAKLAKASV